MRTKRVFNAVKKPLVNIVAVLALAVGAMAAGQTGDTSDGSLPSDTSIGAFDTSDPEPEIVDDEIELMASTAVSQRSSCKGFGRKVKATSMNTLYYEAAFFINKNGRGCAVGINESGSAVTITLTHRRLSKSPDALCHDGEVKRTFTLRGYKGAITFPIRGVYGSRATVNVGGASASRNFGEQSPRSC